MGRLKKGANPKVELRVNRKVGRYDSKTGELIPVGTKYYAYKKNGLRASLTPPWEVMAVPPWKEESPKEEAPLNGASLPPGWEGMMKSLANR